MKNTVLAVALTLAGSAFAQDQAQRHAPNPHKAAMRIAQQLNLSPEQTAKLEPILADRQQKVQALRADTSLSDADRRKSMHTIQVGTRLQMGDVLTPDQMKQLKSLRKKHMDDAADPAGA